MLNLAENSVAYIIGVCLCTCARARGLCDLAEHSSGLCCVYVCVCVRGGVVGWVLNLAENSVVCVVVVGVCFSDLGQVSIFDSSTV